MFLPGFFGGGAFRCGGGYLLADAVAMAARATASASASTARELSFMATPEIEDTSVAMTSNDHSCRKWDLRRTLLYP